jgi:hypothetical protein
MRNPFKADRSAEAHDNPVVPNVVERPVERAADRAAMYDNPIVPNEIERPVERAVADERGAFFNRPGIIDRPHVNDEPVAQPRVTNQPSDAARGVAASSASTNGTNQMDLFPNEELVGYRSRWESIQAGFVDQPRAAVEQADALVSQVVTRLTEMFTRERSTLEGQWTKGDNVSTEDLRIALTRYRSFFHRLLSV